jgi:predicted nucleic acid-binding protein
LTIIDTSVWIEFLRDKNETISLKVIELLENGMALGLSPLFAELLQGVKNEDEERVVLDIWANIPKVPESNLFIEAGKMSFRNKLISKGIGIVDVCILVAAKQNQANIWTLDRKLAEAYHKL